MTKAEPIIRLAAKGDGVTASGRFFPLAAPGDKVAADGTITPGRHRQAPPCQHFGRCGGCQLQHVDDGAYRQFLKDRIIGALHAQGLDAPVRDAILSPPATRRRVAMRAMRIGRRVVLGFAEAKSHRLVDVRQCPVLRPELVAMVPPLRELLRYLITDRRVATIRMTMADQGIDLSLEGISAEGLEAAEALSEFGTRHALARIAIDEGYGMAARYEPQPVTITLGGRAVPLPFTAFLQATTQGEAALCAAATEALGQTSRRADLFAGIGSFTFSCGAAYAAEGARDALLALRSAARSNGVAMEVEHRDLFRRPLTVKDLQRFDGVIIDPPRAGAHEQVEQLAASAVARIAYVSCNPATFARDAKALIDGGYTLEWVQPVGQFLWSTHVELAAAFAR